MNRDNNLLAAALEYVERTDRELRVQRLLNDALAVAAFLALCGMLYAALKYAPVVAL
jgi:hypothetical protein